MEQGKIMFMRKNPLKVSNVFIIYTIVFLPNGLIFIFFWGDEWLLTKVIGPFFLIIGILCVPLYIIFHPSYLFIYENGISMPISIYEKKVQKKRIFIRFENINLMIFMLREVDKENMFKIIDLLLIDDKSFRYITSILEEEYKKIKEILLEKSVKLCDFVKNNY